jgi:hypothetical protein
MEKLARDKEEKFAAELKALDRRKELLDRIAQIGEEEKKVSANDVSLSMVPSWSLSNLTCTPSLQLSEQVAPIHAKIKKRESEKQRVRSLANEEEKELRATLNSFDGAVKNLRMLTKRLDDYLSSDKPIEMEQISAKVSKLLDRIEANKAKLLELEPTLESVKRAVDDQERHKKMLKQNIDVLEAEDRMKQKQKQIESLESELLGVEGHSTVGAEYQEAKNLKGELQRKKANYDGRFSSLVEQIRALKVRRCAS